MKILLDYIWELSDPADSNGNATFKAQKDSKDIVKTDYVTSMVQL